MVMNSGKLKSVLVIVLYLELQTSRTRKVGIGNPESIARELKSVTAILFYRARKNNDRKRCDRKRYFFLRPEIGQSSPDFGDNSFLNELHKKKKPGETGETIHWRKFTKSSGDGAPKLQMFVPCRGRMRSDLN